MSKIAIVFPGQGSQKVGMGIDIFNHPESKPFIQEANQILGLDIVDLSINGPEETLKLTKNAQPAIFLMSFLLYKHLEKNDIKPSYIAGHSLGELTAYAASDVLSFKSSLELIKKRGDEMNMAATATPSGMAAIMGFSPEQIQNELAEFSTSDVVIANYNCPGQIVISGKKDFLDKACQKIKSAGAKVIPLPVSGAFHSPIMQAASNALESYTNQLNFHNAKTPIILNKSASEETTKERLQENISKQVISPVRWIETIELLSKHVDTIIECGPGRVLTGLIKKISKDIKVHTINSLESISELKGIKENV